MAFFKKSKRYLSDSDSENETDLTRFKITESLDETKSDQLSPFLMEKIISSWCNPKYVKKLRNGNLLVEVLTKIHAENILKMDKFHNIKCKAYPHARLNTSKGVRSS